MNKEINLFDEEIQVSVLQNSSEDSTQVETLEKEECEASQAFQVKRIIEALLFVAHEPLSFVKLREVMDEYHPLKPRILRQLIEELQKEYELEQRAFKIEEVAQGFILVTLKEYSHYIEQLYRHKRTEKLSQAATEVLAIIAYRQPITKPQVEAIRGVDSSGTLQNLLERGLIEAVGKLEAPGRPTLYGITKSFLTHFGLKDVNALPKFKDPTP